MDRAFIDPFHSHNGAFATSQGPNGRVYTTNDMGMSWNQLKLDVKIDG